MGTKWKRLRMYEYSNLKAKSLCDICDWNNFDNIAIEYHNVTKARQISYAELYTTHLTISNVLQQIKPAKFIGIYNDVPEYCIPSLMLGIMASTKAFVNLSGSLEENRKLLDCISIKYLFACNIIPNTKVVEELEIHNTTVLLLELYETEKETDTYSESSFAYAITTSGSTGIPKIVNVPHASIVPNIWDLKIILELTKLDRVIQLTSLTFDPAIVEIFLTFSCGGTLIMVSKNLKNDTNRLLEVIYEHNVTILQSTPSLLLCRWSSDHVRTTIFSKDSSLRVCLLGGEPFPDLHTLSNIVHSENKTRFFNIYGITEVSCWGSINEVSKNDKNMDHTYLGEVLTETIFQVRDEKDNILKVGEGILYIGSLSRVCCIDNETLNNLKQPIFRNSGDVVTIDNEGRISYKGRHNRIVKRFGNRVNLQKLVDIVQELNFIEYSYAHWDEHRHRLYMFLTTTKPIVEHTLLKFNILKHFQKFPAHYKPDEIHFIKHFKLTRNGKVSQQFLEEVCAGNGTLNKHILCTEKQTIQEVVKNIWNNYVPPNNDGFIDSGGTSVDALQFSVTISEAFNHEFPELIGMLLQNATFEKCLSYINKSIPRISSEKTDIVTTCVKSPYKIMVDKQIAATEDEDNTVMEKGPWFWQKCRGKLSSFKLGDQSTAKSTINEITHIHMERRFNLQKCVDASPTMSRYSDGTILLTVGSHAGTICTLQMGLTELLTYYVQLPNRIEGSILILNDFKAIIGCYDGHVYCVHLKSGQVIWKFKTKDIVKCTATLCRDGQRLFIGSYDHHIYCLLTEDGSCIWRSADDYGSICASGCLHTPTNSVLFGTLNGTCLALEQITGKVIWQQKLQDPIFVAPVVLSNGFALFCSVAGMVSCFDIIRKETVWTYAVNGNVFAYPVTYHDQFTQLENIIIASMNKNVYCLQFSDTSDTKAPILKRTYNFETPIYATPWYENDFLFIACTDGTCKLVSCSKSKVLASIKLPGETFSSPIFHNDTAFVGCRDNHLYVLKFT